MTRVRRMALLAVVSALAAACSSVVAADDPASSDARYKAYSGNEMAFPDEILGNDVHYSSSGGSASTGRPDYVRLPGGVDSITTAKGGTVFDDDGLSYVSAEGYVGHDEFVYEACADLYLANDVCDQATIRIDVVPFAVTAETDGPYRIEPGESLRLEHRELTRNDGITDDLPAQGPTVSLVAGRKAVKVLTTDEGGFVSQLDTAHVRYVPPVGFRGEDRFEYEVCFWLLTRPLGSDRPNKRCGTGVVEVVVEAEPRPEDDEPDVVPSTTTTLPATTTTTAAPTTTEIESTIVLGAGPAFDPELDPEPTEWDDTPVPAGDVEFTITNETLDPQTFTIEDSLGAEVLRLDITAGIGDFEVDTVTLTPGAYTVKIGGVGQGAFIVT